jgi:hypothetical protein
MAGNPIPRRQVAIGRWYCNPTAAAGTLMALPISIATSIATVATTARRTLTAGAEVVSLPRSMMLMPPPLPALISTLWSPVQTATATATTTTAAATVTAVAFTLSESHGDRDGGGSDGVHVIRIRRTSSRVSLLNLAAYDVAFPLPQQILTV